MTERPEQASYRITIEGHLDESWAEWLENPAITHDAAGNTILSGPQVDQAALHGILRKIRDLNLTLISVDRIESGLNALQGEQR